MDNFGLRIKELRRQKNLSQTQMAMRLHISRSAYSNYETGIRFPDARTLCDIADIFAVSVDYLLNHKTIK